MPKKYKICGRVVLRQIGDESLLVPVSGDVAGGRVYPLNETAKQVWLGVTDGQTLDEMHAALQQQFPVPADVLRRDCKAFLDSLVGEGLIEEIPA